MADKPCEKPGGEMPAARVGRDGPCRDAVVAQPLATECFALLSLLLHHNKRGLFWCKSGECLAGDWLQNKKQPLPLAL